VGASCDLGAWWGLPRIVGLRRALQIALLSDPFDVEQALVRGIVNWIVPEQSLETEAMAVAGRLAAGPTIAIGNIKKLMRASFQHFLSDAEQRFQIAKPGATRGASELVVSDEAQAPSADNTLLHLSDVYAGRVRTLDGCRRSVGNIEDADYDHGAPQETTFSA